MGMCFRSGDNIDIDQCVRTADEQMYEQKLNTKESRMYKLYNMGLNSNSNNKQSVPDDGGGEISLAPSN